MRTAAALADLTVLDESGTAIRAGSLWQHRVAALAFVRHFA